VNAGRVGKAHRSWSVKGAGPATLKAAYAILDETTGLDGPDTRACSAALADSHAGWAKASPEGSHAAEADRWNALARDQRP